MEEEVLTDLARLAFVRACRPRLVYKNFVLAHTQLAARKKKCRDKKMQDFFFQP